MQQNSPEYTAWQEELPALLHEISLPVFPEVIFDITEYGAIAGGTYSCTKAVQAAIDACALAGGGKVVIPPGTFLSAGLYLRSNVNLHLQEGAVLLFFTEPEHYLPLVHTRWEGIELFNYAPMLYAYGETNIAITGSGILDGQASAANWWCWRGQEQWGWQPGMPCQNDAHARSALFAMGEQEVPLSERVFGPGFYLRPNLVQFYQCEQVLVEGVRLQNAPMWALHPVRCKNVTLQHLHISTHGPSGDGCNPESCCRVLIRYCHFDVSHDAIALKSGRNREGRRLAIPCEKVVIQHCSFAGGHGGITLGSESSGVSGRYM